MRITRKMVKSAGKIIIFSSLLLLVAGCATTPADSTGDVPMKPAWVEQYPKDNAFYVGIGSSNTGVEADDMELARARALNAVAAEISTEIKSSTSFREVDDGEGGVERSAEEEINAVVAQNLQAVETMDSWYSSESGGWYYVRLNKAEWEAIQTREMNDIKRRVLDLVEPVIIDKNRTLTEALSALASGWKIVAASPYTGMIRAELDGEEGSLIDLLEKRVGYEFASIRIEVEPDEAVFETGRPANLSISVSSELRSRTGQLSLDMVADAGAGDVIFTLMTSPMGTYDEPVNLAGLNLGKNYVSVKYNTSSEGLPSEFKFTPPQKDILIDLQQLKAGFRVSFGGDVEDPAALGGVEGTARAFFTGQLPVKLVREQEESAFDIEFNLQYRNAPPNDYGLVIIYVKANISVIKDGRILYTFETEEYKGGGLNWSQANSKALEKLFPALEESSDFLQGIVGAFSLD
ncbi:MAG: LPP20 family lipoprotein [Spirochaetales bacterium]|nr:LPP20 family lipoprotein [Spirochaetales bacterium]